MKIDDIVSKIKAEWTLKFNERVLLNLNTGEEISITEKTFNLFLDKHPLVFAKHGFKLKERNDRKKIVEPRIVKDRTIIKKPWGFYILLQNGKDFKIKILCVYPGQRLSLQSHNLRSEIWVCISGNGCAELGNRVVPIERDKIIRIPVGEKHRLENEGREILVINETQFGECDENDIVRYEDDYGRKKKAPESRRMA